MGMELESIYWARQRWLKLNHGGRLATLEDLSAKSLQRSDDRWQRIKWLAEMAPKILSLLRVLYTIWPLVLAAGAFSWTLLLPAARWLWRWASSGLAWLAGLGVG